VRRGPEDVDTTGSGVFGIQNQGRGISESRVGKVADGLIELVEELKEFFDGWELAILVKGLGKVDIVDVKGTTKVRDGKKVIKVGMRDKPGIDVLNSPGEKKGFDSITGELKIAEGTSVAGNPERVRVW
jgi:hypothetical protein